MPPEDWEYWVCWRGWQSRELAAALLADGNPVELPPLLELFSLSPFLQGTKVSFRQESTSSCKNSQADKPSARRGPPPRCFLQPSLLGSRRTLLHSSHSQSHVQ